MIFFISDLHFGHRAICKYRTQFSTPEEHDEFVIEKWNSVIKKSRQHVWVLGDVCIKNKYYDHKKMLKRLNGTIHIVPGNHDYLPAYQGYDVQSGLVKRYGVWLSHCPIHPVELRGHKHLHGHVHFKTLPDDRYMNVCCEAVNYTPLALEDIRDWIQD